MKSAWQGSPTLPTGKNRPHDCCFAFFRILHVADPEPLLVLTGPTASGKSSLALRFARARKNVEILSMDSMAVFRGMDVGTAKPTREERDEIPHHLLDLAPPHASFDTHAWCNAAAAAVADVRARGCTPLFVGGTPLDLMAVFTGMMEGPGRDEALRASLSAQEDAEPGHLHTRLLAVDPEAAGRIHRNDRKRLVRALEVFTLTGKPISASQSQFDQPGWKRPCRILSVHRPREELRERVRARTIAMLGAGLVEETRAIQDGDGFSREAAAAIGTAECLAWLRGAIKDDEELRNRIRRSTHKLVRRQTTWLRRMAEVQWIAPDLGAAEVAEAFASPAPERPPVVDPNADPRLP